MQDGSSGASKSSGESSNQGGSEGRSMGGSESDSEGGSKGVSEGDSEGVGEGGSKGDSKGVSEGVSEGDGEGGSEGGRKDVREGVSEGDSKGGSEGGSEGGGKGDGEGGSVGPAALCRGALLPGRGRGAFGNNPRDRFQRRDRFMARHSNVCKLPSEFIQCVTEMFRKTPVPSQFEGIFTPFPSVLQSRSPSRPGLPRHARRAGTTRTTSGPGPHGRATTPHCSPLLPSAPR